MQEREFEKQVQEQMQGFDLEPSSEVWMNVENRIRKEKKRRFIAWWFTAALLIISGAIYYAWYKSGPKAEKEIAAIPAASPAAKTTASKESDTAIVKTAPNEILPGIEKGSNNDIHREAGTILTGKHNQTNSIRYTTETGEKTGDGIIKSTGPIKISKRKQAEAGSERTKKTDFADDRTKDEIVVTNAAVDMVAKNNLPLAQGRASDLPQGHIPRKTDSLKTAIDNPVTVTQKQDSDTAAVAKVIPAGESQKIKRKNKWEIGLSLFAGKSNLGDGLRFSQNKTMPDAFTQGAVPPSPSTPQYLVRDPQSSVSAGVGFFVKRKLSEKLNFYGDFKYTYLSTRVLTGNKVDSTPFANNGPVFTNAISATSFFRPATSANNSYYTNRYHYLNLSAGISWNVISGKRFKLYWDNSIGYGRLLGSNMLHYNSSLPGYYKDNELLSKNQFFFSTGFTVPVSERLELSASVTYTPSSLLKNTSGDKLHFTQFGIGLRYFLKK